MHVSKIFKVERLEELIEQGLISRQKHPELNLFIYNYTQQTQFQRAWNEVTLTCRGLILDSNYNIVARPFPKFFNIEEHSRSDILFSREFQVFEKLDGSLGIMYYVSGDPHYTTSYAIATRGSFTSDQAIKGTSMLHATTFRYSGQFHPDNNYTYLFEIIYPQNKIVVDYGNIEDLVFLCAVHKETGSNVFEFGSLADWPWYKASRYNFDCHPRDISTKHVFDNAEGYVLYFPSKNTRMKAKLEEYVRLHRIVTNVSTKTIWRGLRNDEPLNDILDNVPDEFYAWVTKVKDDLQDKWLAEMSRVNAQFKKLIDEHFEGDAKIAKANRKAFAEQVLALSSKNNGLLFSVLDGKSIGDAIWDQIEPAYERPTAFIGDDE